MSNGFDRDLDRHSFVLFGLMFDVPVNSYGHVDGQLTY